MHMQKILCENCLEETPYNIVQENITTKIKGITVTYQGKHAYCEKCGNPTFVNELLEYNKQECYAVFSKMSENKKLNIPEYKLEDLLDGFEAYQNHLEWEDIPPVGREI